MLCRLEVSNYALIENVELTFEKGFTVITGETGAGKSILLKALHLLLGERVDTAVLKQSENKCFLEATFDIEKLKLQSFFAAHELDYDQQCIVRREFTNTGKSRCFINDTPVQLNVLKDLGELLIAIHAQHETLALFEPGFQFDVLDHYAGLQSTVAAYAQKYKTYRALLLEAEQLRTQEAQNRKEKDYKTFLLNELNAANLQHLNIDALQAGYGKIQNAEKITEALKNAGSLFENDRLSPINTVRSLIQVLDELKTFDPKFAELHTRLLSTKIELEDISNELQREMDSTDYADADAQQVKDKIDLFNSLAYKHNVADIAGLVKLRDELEAQISAIDSVENALKKTENEIEVLQKELLTEARGISKKRMAKIPALEKTINGLLAGLAMPDAGLQVDLKQDAICGLHGVDHIEFLFKTNAGGQFLPVKKIASGGELARLMLTILSTLSQTKNLPTLIFDEIDTGVSGEVASKMAAEFSRIGKNIQVIVITHLPQVAARGDVHLHVSKEKRANKTVTMVKNLGKSDRVTELAKMISGEKVTDAAKENAMNLLNIS